MTALDTDTGPKKQTGGRIFPLWKLTGKRKAVGRIFGENAKSIAYEARTNWQKDREIWMYMGSFVRLYLSFYVTGNCAKNSVLYKTCLPTVMYGAAGGI